MEVTDVSTGRAGISLEWSLFHTTLCSYKSHSYLNDNVVEYGNKNFLEKLSVQISKIIRQSNPLSNEVIEFFTLVQKHQCFKLFLCTKTELNEFIKTFSSIKSNNDNCMLFKCLRIDNNNLTNSKSPPNNFDLLSKQFGTFVAVHGSHMNRFYSILQKGLCLPKNDDIPGLFGSGIYLTNKLDVAFHFAQAHLFDCGLFEGHSIKAVAVCEVIKHPTAVVRKEHKESDGFSFSGNIPPEYFLVKDECMVRVTHVFIQSSSPISNIETIFKSDSGVQISESFLQILRRHWLLFTIVTYILLLITISYFTGNSVIFSNWDSSDLLDINN